MGQNKGAADKSKVTEGLGFIIQEQGAGLERWLGG